MTKIESSNLYATLATLIDRLDGEIAIRAEAIGWSCPILSFGNPSLSHVATVGINPSNREFMDAAGAELKGPSRRFHTLQSLDLTSWSDADARHLTLILETYCTYFTGNPYNNWFRRLELLLSGLGVSYYDSLHTACHFDLVPYATERKWSELALKKQSSLLGIAGNSFGPIVRDSSVDLLILNGNTVVRGLEALSGVQFDSEPIHAWALQRKSTHDVQGVSFKGKVDMLAGVHLGRDVKVIGFNHNIQSSFGVSTEVVSSIRNWISQTIECEEW